MSIKYRAKEGDVLDAIAHQHYGYVNSDVLNAVIEANKDSLLDGDRLQAGQIVVLPKMPETKEASRTIRLWD